jgi:hypothetical protein
MKPITVSNTAWPAVIGEVFSMAVSFPQTAKNGHMNSTDREQYRSLHRVPPPENHRAGLIAGQESLV